ncbi:hypothetical protein XELAEV_18002347mg, partial [Xenopus laevis]
RRHFVDRYRPDVISRASNIDPVLDYLLAENVLTQEQYDTVRSKDTCQERMRQLYGYVWCNLPLKIHNRTLIRELETT